MGSRPARRRLLRFVQFLKQFFVLEFEQLVVVEFVEQFLVEFVLVGIIEQRLRERKQLVQQFERIVVQQRIVGKRFLVQRIEQQRFLDQRTFVERAISE